MPDVRMVEDREEYRPARGILAAGEEGNGRPEDPAALDFFSLRYEINAAPPGLSH
jgi:hypothetical protein